MLEPMITARKMGGQTIGQVVDSISPSDRQRDRIANASAETGRTANSPDAAAAVIRIEEYGPIADGSEERGRDLYRL